MIDHVVEPPTICEEKKMFCACYRLVENSWRVSQMLIISAGCLGKKKES